MDYSAEGLQAASKARELFAPELSSGENIVWVGQPNRSVIFHKEDWFAIPFSLLWGGFAIFWEYMATGGFGAKPSGGGWFMTLWGIPFIVVGQYLIWGRFIYADFKKKRTYYALTNQRALILIVGRGRKLRAAFLNSVPAINKWVRSDGIGTITFGDSTIWDNEFIFQPKGTYKEQDPAFCDIFDAEMVFQLAMQQRKH